MPLSTKGKIAFKKWKRDFRSEFAIGNYSDCCIAIGGDETNKFYPDVLLDYFLDLSITVIHMNFTPTDSEESSEIGQIYLVGLIKQEDLSSTLAVSSVDIVNELKEDTDLVKPVITSIADPEVGFAKKYNFDQAITGCRYSGFWKYNDKVRRDIQKLDQASRQKLRDFRNKRESIKQSNSER